MARYLMIRHRVRDFDAWKAGYDAHLPHRIEAGLEEKHLLRGADDPHQVVVLFETLDLARARSFATSPDLAEAMRAAGVIDQPEILFLNG
jgi:hypothetical protein